MLPLHTLSRFNQRALRSPNREALKGMLVALALEEQVFANAGPVRVAMNFSNCGSGGDSLLHSQKGLLLFKKISFFNIPFKKAGV